MSTRFIRFLALYLGAIRISAGAGSCFKNTPSASKNSVGSVALLFGWQLNRKDSSKLMHTLRVRVQ